MKFLTWDGTAKKIKEFIAIVTSAGAGDAGKIPGLDAAGKLDISFMPTGVGSAAKTITTSEALSPGPVNVWNDAGTVKVRKADATAVGKEADGFVIASFSSGVSATVYFSDELSGMSGLTLGGLYFLTTTAGVVSTTPPSAAGNIIQSIGKAVSTSSIMWEPSAPIELA